MKPAAQWRRESHGNVLAQRLRQRVRDKGVNPSSAAMRVPVSLAPGLSKSEPTVQLLTGVVSLCDEV